MSWRGPLRSPSSFWAGTAAAVLLGAVVSARAIYQAPLNVDEELTRRIASGRFGSIFSIVVNQRGGGPVHFWLVHLTLQWPGGLIGLRAPSLVFFLLALPAVALLARELAGVTAGVVTVLLTSCAPLAVTYATFGRPHTLLFAWISWGTFVALRAARTGSRGWWIVGGLILGTAVFTHPTAPIYELAAFAAALALAPQPPRELLRRAWPGAVALALTTIPYEAVTARVISNRYGVSASARHGRTFDHKPVWQNAVRFVSPDGHGRLLNWLTVLAVAGVATLILRRRHRELAAVAVVLVLPVLFFTYVPANGLSSLFFDRYVLPPLPLFLFLIAVGASGIASLAGRLWPAALTALVAGAIAVQVTTVQRHNHHLAKLQLNHVTEVVRAESSDAVLFGSAGTMDTTGFLGALNFGRGPNLLDRYLAMRIPSLQLVNDDTCVPVVAYLRGPQRARHGLFLFYANNPDAQAAASSAFAGIDGVRVTSPASRYYLVRTTNAMAPRALVVLALQIRRAWASAEPTNPRAGDLVASDRQALAAPGACVPRGPLGDPDISPNFPEIVT